MKKLLKPKGKFAVALIVCHLRGGNSHVPHKPVSKSFPAQS